MPAYTVNALLLSLGASGTVFGGVYFQQHTQLSSLDDAEIRLVESRSEEELRLQMDEQLDDESTSFPIPPIAVAWCIYIAALASWSKHNHASTCRQQAADHSTVAASCKDMQPLDAVVGSFAVSSPSLVTGAATVEPVGLVALACDAGPVEKPPLCDAGSPKVMSGDFPPDVIGAAPPCIAAAAGAVEAQPASPCEGSRGDQWSDTSGQSTLREV